MESENEDKISEIDIRSCISYREELIERLMRAVKLSVSLKPKHFPILARDLVSISKSLREVGLKCVQRIVSWIFQTSIKLKKSGNGYLPSPPIFEWNGVDYLSKMLHDLDFAAKELPSSLRAHGNFSVADPLFIRKGASIDALSRKASVAATLVILDAATRYAEKEQEKARQAALEAKAAETVVYQGGKLKKKIKSFRKVLAMTRLMESETRASLSSQSEDEREEVATDLQGLIWSYTLQGGGGGGGGGKGDSSDSKLLDCERADGLHCVVRALDMMVQETGLAGGFSPSPPASLTPCPPSLSRSPSKRFTRDQLSSNNQSGMKDRKLHADGRKAVQRELSILKTIGHHPFVVEVLEVIHDDFEGFVFVIMEKMPATLLQIPVDRLSSFSTDAPLVHTTHKASSNHRHRHRHRNSVTPELLQSLVASMLQQLLEALKHIHSLNIMHNDIRPAHIFVSPRLMMHGDHGDIPMVAGGYIAKLGDFEHASLYSPDNDTESGGGDNVAPLVDNPKSLRYRAPERLRSPRPCGPPSDVWALGASIYEFLTGDHYAEGKDEQEVLDSLLAHHTLVPYTVHRLLEGRGLHCSSPQQKPKRELDVELCLLCRPLRHKLESMLELLAMERGTEDELRLGLQDWIL